MALWEFALQGDVVRQGSKTRKKLTQHGCNEPFKNWYWCPKKQWFMKEACPFVNKHECRNYESMCGKDMAQM